MFLLLQSPVILMSMTKEPDQTDTDGTAQALAGFSFAVTDDSGEKKTVSFADSPTDSPVAPSSEPGSEPKKPRHSTLTVPGVGHHDRMPSLGHHRVASAATVHKGDFKEVLKTNDIVQLIAFFKSKAITEQGAITEFLKNIETKYDFDTGILDYVLKYGENLDVLKLLHHHGAQVKGLKNTLSQVDTKVATEVITAWARDYSQRTIEWLIANDDCIVLSKSTSQNNKIIATKAIERISHALQAHPNYTDNKDPVKLAARVSMAHRIIELYTAKVNPTTALKKKKRCEKLWCSIC